MTRQIMAREGRRLVVAGLLFILLLTALQGVGFPMIGAAWYARQPYAPLTDIDARRVGNTMQGAATVTKILPCDPSAAPPPYFRWQWGDSIATSAVMIRDRTGVDREMQPRRVVDPGVAVRVEGIVTRIPDMIPDGVSPIASLVVVCDPGDGRLRSWRLTPDLAVPASDGPVAPVRGKSAP